MEYKIMHLKPGGESESCGTLRTEGDLFDFITEKAELSSLLEKVKQQGYVARFHDGQPPVTEKVKPSDNEFISVLEEYLGNYRLIEFENK